MIIAHKCINSYNCRCLNLKYIRTCEWLRLQFSSSKLAQYSWGDLCTNFRFEK